MVKIFPAKHLLVWLSTLQMHCTTSSLHSISKRVLRMHFAHNWKKMAECNQNSQRTKTKTRFLSALSMDTLVKLCKKDFEELTTDKQTNISKVGWKISTQTQVLSFEVILNNGLLPRCHTTIIPSSSSLHKRHRMRT